MPDMDVRQKIAQMISGKKKDDGRVELILEEIVNIHYKLDKILEALIEIKSHPTTDVDVLLNRFKDINTKGQNIQYKDKTRKEEPMFIPSVDISNARTSKSDIKPRKAKIDDSAFKKAMKHSGENKTNE